MWTQIKGKWNNHKTDIIGFVKLETVTAFDLIDAKDEDKNTYYQIVLQIEWLNWLFYEMTLEDRTLLVNKLIDLWNTKS